MEFKDEIPTSYSKKKLLYRTLQDYLHIFCFNFGLKFNIYHKFFYETTFIIALLKKKFTQ